MPDIAILVSMGRHPVSNRPFRALQDAQALALALTVPGCSIAAVHAGQAQAARNVMSDYLGMGAPAMTILDIPERADPLPALLRHLMILRPRMILTGSKAETGETSGMVPFWLAERLGWPVVQNIVSVSADDDGQATLIQALPGGARRKLQVSIPFVGTVGPGAPNARLSAIGRIRKGHLSVVPMDAEYDIRHRWEANPARARPRRMVSPRIGNAASRLQSVLGRQSTDQEFRSAHTGLSPDDAAATILAYLRREGLLPPGTSGTDQPR